MSKLAALFDDIDLFNGMPYAEVDLLAGYCQILDTQRDQLLFQEGEPGDALYIVLEGKVQVNKMIHDKPQPVSVEGKGKVLGEMALLDGEARSATCRTLDKARVVVLTREAFARMEKEHPALALHFLKLIMRLVSRRLRMMTGKLPSP